MNTNEYRQFKDQFDRIIGRFYQDYALRWAEQKLTGKIDLTLNFFQGGLGKPNLGEDTSIGTINDREVVKLEDFENAVRFSELK